MAFATCLATAIEKRQRLPGDRIISDPIFDSTHAITIDATPDKVWPWIAQMGAGRAGWYSWDFIDNGGTPSASRRVPELQSLRPGDVMPAAPGAVDAFVVEAVEPMRDLILTAPDGRGGHSVVWEHTLIPAEGGRTRLLARARASSRWIDLARAPAPAGHHPLLIEQVYGALARLPRPLLIAFARLGHRVMEARHLRGIARRSVGENAFATIKGGAWLQFLIVCGILSSLLYGAMIWLITYEGYSLISQVPSELTAVGAPTADLWARLAPLYGVLVTAFGAGVWTIAGRNNAIRFTGASILAFASLGLLWPFAQMHQREVIAAGGGTIEDTMHQVLGGVTVLLMFVALSFGAASFGKRFRIYTITSIVVLLVFGGLTFLDAPNLATNLPTPFIGLWERISITVFLVWIAAFAIALLRGSDRKRGRRAEQL